MIISFFVSFSISFCCLVFLTFFSVDIFLFSLATFFSYLSFSFLTAFFSLSSFITLGLKNPFFSADLSSSLSCNFYEKVSIFNKFAAFNFSALTAYSFLCSSDYCFQSSATYEKSRFLPLLCSSTNMLY